MSGHWEKLAELAPFGTHRPSAPVSTGDTVRSFVAWASNRGLEETVTHETAFDRLYGSLDLVTGFGRTARSDFARLLGLLGLSDAWPERCYLEGASGPQRGAMRMLLGQETGWVEAAWLERRCSELAGKLAINTQAIEDAICNWQKSGWEVSPGVAGLQAGTGKDPRSSTGKRSAQTRSQKP